MARHEQPDVSFDVPRHWEDKTLVAYAAPPQPEKATTANLVMTRDSLLDREMLADYADRQLTELSARLDDFELDRREQTTLGGQPAIILRFTSRSQSGTLVQRLCMVEGRRRLVYCFTATSPKADQAQNDPLFDRILGTLRFPLMAPREGGEAT
ncbi:MAG: DcrB-related protein [Byssovorax sp.]